jgi:hypothetical protein
MTDISLEALKLREKELSLDAVMIRGRIEELRHIIAEVERRRGGRPRNVSKLNPHPQQGLVPQRVAGGVAETEMDEQGELPSIEEMRGILKETTP